ncbi:trypsin-like serine protease [Streptomyces sp. NPDC058255]|uniref:trypsin-like serine protease n=1 Tax=Streptomyces sp. NPDC058255 TaxID=3346407 RepID=UPI0036E3C49F
MDPRRLADICAGDAQQRRSRGSGYLIGPELVLTARHVVVNSRTGGDWTTIAVRIGHPDARPGSIEQRQATVLWTHPSGDDVALLELDEPVEVGGSVRWGRPEGPTALAYTGLGFPLHTVGAHGSHGVEQLRGMLPPLASGLGGRLYVLDQAAAPRLRSDGLRAWGGVSGAAVFCQDLLVGVAVWDDEEHENRRLHAVPAHIFATESTFAHSVVAHGGPAPVVVPVAAQPLLPRSGYLLEVQELAATRFEGRQREIAEMTAFCTAAKPDVCGYWRWLAPPWAGKTALMAQFALQPPADIDVLAFFITARAPGQSDRTAFLTALQAQLREYLRDGALACTSKGQFLHALARAAEQAAAAGRTLVLLVDGLDEDIGVTTGSTGYSIAALLPRVLPAGMLIMVAGRPNPPTPSDVAKDHPLRGTACDHWLETHPAAQVIREDAERNLDALLSAGGLGQQLVGLMAAAGGGLDVADLAEMTGQAERRVELVLDGSVGRAFQRRPGQWPAQDGHTPRLFSFAHQELLDGAQRLLSPTEMGGYLQQVHALVDRRRRAGWPLTTSEYCLVGYPQLLRALGDMDRLTHLATDVQRQECLGQITGADAEALAEIVEAFQLHLAADEPDIDACLRLALSRDHLLRRADSTPDDLVLAWARLGQPRRAVALARSTSHYPRLARLLPLILRADPQPIATTLVTTAARTVPDPRKRAPALLGICRILVGEGRLRDAVAMAREAADDADCITHQGERAMHLAEAARVLATAGEQPAAVGIAEKAARIADACADPDDRVVKTVALALSEAGLYEEAVLAAHSLSYEPQRIAALAKVVLAAAGRGQDTLPIALETDKRARLYCLKNGDNARNPKAWSLTWAAQALAAVGRDAKASKVIHRAADTLRNEEAPEPAVIAALAQAQAALGRYGEAARSARSLASYGERVRALTQLALSLAEAGRWEEAGNLLKNVKEPRVNRPGSRVQELGEAVVTLADAGWQEVARTTADLTVAAAQAVVTPPEARARAMATAAHALAAVGDTEKAATTAISASRALRAITHPHPQAKVLAEAARTLAQAGHHEDAVAAARAIPIKDQRVRVLAEVACALSAQGRHNCAARLTQDAHAAMCTLPESPAKLQAVNAVARAMTMTGHSEDGIGVANELPKEHGGVYVLREVVRTLTALGCYHKAKEAARDLPVEFRAEAWAHLALELAAAGQQAAADNLAGKVLNAVKKPDDSTRYYRDLRGQIDRDARARALVDIIRTPGLVGRREVAVTLACASSKASDLTNVALALTESGYRQEAVAIAKDAMTAAFALKEQPFTTERQRHEAVAYAVEALVTAGCSSDAAAIARALPAEAQSAALAGAASALAKASLYDEATTMAHDAIAAAQELAYVSDQDRLLARLTPVLAEAGRIQEARETARALTQPAIRAQALADLSVRSTDARTARALLAEALSVGDAVFSLQALAQLTPAAMGAVAALAVHP